MSDPESEGLSARTRQQLLRWGGRGILVLVFAGSVLLVTVRRVFDAETLERHLDTAVVEATDGRYRVGIEAVEWGLFLGSLRLERVTLHPDSGNTADDRFSSPAPVHVSVSSLSLQGMGLWALLWHRVLWFEEVLVQRPSVALRPGGTSASDPDTSAVATAPAAGPEGILADVGTEQFRVQDGTLVRGAEERPPRDSLWGVSLRLRDLSLDSARAQKLRPYMVRRFTEGQVEGYRRRMPDAFYRFRTGAGRLSRQDSTLRLTNLRLEPMVSDEAFAQRHTYRVNRFRTAAKEVTAAEVDVQRFVEEGAVRADRVHVDSLELEVYRDNHKPVDPEEPPPPMPQEAVEELTRFVRIDTLRVQQSRIQYTKRPEGVFRTGTIAFEDLWASAYRLTANPQHRPTARPAVVEARTRVNGAGLLRTTFRIPLHAPHLNLSFQGRLGAMAARAFNETFIPLGGVRIERGQVDSLWFRAEVERGTATGSLGAVYRELEIETLDKATGERGLRERLKTTVAGLALRSKNHPSEDPFHKGEIDYTRNSDETFFKFLWLAVRDGIYSIVGIDRLPR
jgi:hypothetical protein